MRKHICCFGVILILAGGSLNVLAQELLEKDSFSAVKEIERVKEESFSDFLVDINGGNIFSPPKKEVVVSKKEDIILPPREEIREAELVYRGNLNVGGEKVAMIEKKEDGDRRNYFLKIGEFLEDYRIVDIDRDFVLLLSGEKGEKKLLFEQRRK